MKSSTPRLYTAFGKYKRRAKKLMKMRGYSQAWSLPIDSNPLVSHYVLKIDLLITLNNRYLQASNIDARYLFPDLLFLLL